MKNRDGLFSNGYFGSSDMLDDLYIKDNGHIADNLAKELGFRVYIKHRITSNIETLYRKIRRWWRS